MQTMKLAAIQAAPVFFDKAASLEKALKLIAQAGARGVDVAAFGESWLPGYPFFIDAAPDSVWWDAAVEYAANAISIPGPETDALGAAAKAAGCDIVIGVAERSEPAGATLYCTLLFISREGEILGRHRKIKPTHNERAIWGDGDAEGLKSYPRAYGRLSGLNCWEQNIVLPGFALASAGVDVHVAAWPGREPETAPSDPVWSRQVLLSRAFASAYGCYVIAAAGLRNFEHTPEHLRAAGRFEHNGHSRIIDPFGEVIASAGAEETMLVVEADAKKIAMAKIACDPTGHYSRPDLFELRLRGKRIFGDGEA